MRGFGILKNAYPFRVVADDEDHGDDYAMYAKVVTPEATPDLSDPGTLGCLLALVRKAWGPLFTVHTIPPSWDEPWGCYVRHSGQGMDLKGIKSSNWKGWLGATEAEALIVALEAVPKPAATAPDAPVEPLVDPHDWQCVKCGARGVLPIPGECPGCAAPLHKGILVGTVDPAIFFCFHTGFQVVDGVCSGCHQSADTPYRRERDPPIPTG